MLKSRTAVYNGGKMYGLQTTEDTNLEVKWKIKEAKMMLEIRYSDCGALRRHIECR